MISRSQSFFPGGALRTETWWLGHLFHRTDGPAFVEYYSNGTVKEQRWIVNNQLHRVVWPSIIWFDQYGDIIGYNYYNLDQNITIQVKEYLIEHGLNDPLDISMDHQLIMKMKFW